MKKIGTLLTITISLLLCTISFGQEQAPAPVYQDGDFWQFRVIQKDWQFYQSDRPEGDYEVRFLGGDLQVYKLTAGEKVEVKQGGFELRRMVSNSKDNRQYLQFPLLIKKQWKTQYEIPGVSIGGGAYGIRRIAETTVSGLEEVATLAGTFKAYKIDRFESSTGGHILYTYFYSPHIRSIVKFNYDGSRVQYGGAGRTEIELTKFGSAGQ